MPSALENAKRRLATLRAEVARVERFIRDYEEFAAGTEGDQSERHEISVEKTSEGNVSRIQSVDNLPPAGRRKARPEEIAQIVERVIREVGKPMTRGELVEALERRDVWIPPQDKPRYLGTIIWRNKGTFINIEGRGYWLRNEPLRENGTFWTGDPQEEHSPDLAEDEGAER